MRVRLNDVETRVEELLVSLQPGQSVLSASAYDTAWVALISKRFRDYGFEQAIDWLRSQQHNNGSWGAVTLHYHDRILNTLMCLIALRYAGDSTDNHRIHRGEAFIHRHYRAIRQDVRPTQSFLLLIQRLTSFARSLQIRLPDDMYPRSERFTRKWLYLMHKPGLLARSTGLASLEAFLPDVYAIHPDAQFVSADGSVDGSPAATAANLFFSEEPDRRSLQYLQRLLMQCDNGSVPAMDMDIAEIALALDVLLDSGTVSIRQPQVERLIDDMAAHWNTQTGIGTTTAQHTPDLSSSAVLFRQMRASGYDVDARVFESYEGKQYFECYRGESKPSLMANLRMLAALPCIQNHTRMIRWQHKIQQMLYDNHANPPDTRTDKEHLSPYHLLCKATWTLSDSQPEMLYEPIQHALAHQRSDGGWGVDGSTQEETACAMLALLHWNQHIDAVEPSVLHAGADYLYQHFENTDYEALWLSRVLYAPYQVIHATVLSALHRYERYREQMHPGA